MEPELRSRRALERRTEGRRRLLAAAVLAVLADLAIAPIVVLSIPDTAPPAQPEVALVQIPPSAWDANRGATGAQAPPTATAPTQQPPPPPPAPPPEQPKEKMEHQVVETAPGNNQAPADSKLAAETNNSVQKQTIAKNPNLTEPVIKPKHSDGRSETSKPATPAPGAAVTDNQGEKQDVKPELGQKAETPTTKHRDELALRDDPHGGMAQQDAREQQQGNSDRLRLQVGHGDGDAKAPTMQGAPGSQNRLNLNPSQEQLDKIAGGPAPDLVDGAEKGDATFLNTREWRYASFFNRVKQEVAAQWKPNDVIRRRDPSGSMFLWKDRYTLLGIRLKEDGRLADVWIEHSSGVDFLDEEAITAFQKAEPFPNPPHGLVDDRGEIKFAFGFMLETDHGGPAIFRWQ